MTIKYNHLLERVAEKDRILTALFLDKYWLSVEAYQENWQSKVSAIFPKLTTFEELVINPAYHKLIAISGILITEEALAAYYEIMNITGEAHFLILDIDPTLEPSQLLRLKIPVNTPLSEIQHQSGFSADLTGMTVYDCIVMGENGDWALFSTWNGGYYLPLNLYVYRPCLESVFYTLFREFESERLGLAEHIPARYLKYL